MIKKCVICGSEFEPRYNLINRQICCSKKCTRQRNLELNNYKYATSEDYRIKRASYQKAKKKAKVHYCKLCGKPIEIEYKVGAVSKKTMHVECIIADCIETLETKGVLTRKQYQRLYAIGYTLKDFIEDYEVEVHKTTDWKELNTGLICLN